jgi:anthranilate phosphoribosyltransferase
MDPVKGGGAMFGEHLKRLLEGGDLTRSEARDAMDAIMRGGVPPAQVAGFLVSLRIKGETVEEIVGCAQAMRDHVVPVRPSRDGLVDTAGTGGDGAGTLNLSTAAALVAAAAGARVAKHGNRAVSSSCGSADVLEALGLRIDLGPDAIARSIDQLGFGFLFAPAHHPAMKHAGPVRKELAVRTVFNVLGPLTNPAAATAQLVGVYAADLVPIVAEAMAMLGARRALVVHGAGGIDELSPSGPNLVYEVRDGDVRRRTVDPLDLGIPRCAPHDLVGGSPESNAADIRAIFSGAGGPKRHAALLNAAGAVVVAGLAGDLREGLALATRTVDSGAAGDRLEAVAAFSRAEAAPVP